MQMAFSRCFVEVLHTVGQNCTSISPQHYLVNPIQLLLKIYINSQLSNIGYLLHICSFGKFGIQCFFVICINMCVCACICVFRNACTHSHIHAYFNSCIDFYCQLSTITYILLQIEQNDSSPVPILSLGQLVENTNTIYSAFGFPLQQENWFYILFNSEQHLICFFVHLKISLQF